MPPRDIRSSSPALRVSCERSSTTVLLSMWPSVTQRHTPTQSLHPRRCRPLPSFGLHCCLQTRRGRRLWGRLVTAATTATIGWWAQWRPSSKPAPPDYGCNRPSPGRRVILWGAHLGVYPHQLPTLLGSSAPQMQTTSFLFSVVASGNPGLHRAPPARCPQSWRAAAFVASGKTTPGPTAPSRSAATPAGRRGTERPSSRALYVPGRQATVLGLTDEPPSRSVPAPTEWAQLCFRRHGVRQIGLHRTLRVTTASPAASATTTSTTGDRRGVRLRPP